MKEITHAQSRVAFDHAAYHTNRKVHGGKPVILWGQITRLP